MSDGSTYRDPGTLADVGLVSRETAAELSAVADQYAIAITPTLTRLIDRTDPDDPVARMFIPSVAELNRLPEELGDPIGDERHTPVRGIVHRYPNRVLLKPVGVCPVYCRFCFRREMVGPENGGNLTPAEIEAALDYIRQTPEVREVILTGGDPFMLSAKRARALTSALEAISHVDVIRWHTRMPVADPMRISDEFVAAIKGQRAAVYVSIHVNHAREVGEDALTSIRRMADAGIPLLSQSVLLNGVNNSADALAELFELLIRNRVRPYYLHHPDLAPGTSHFRLSVDEGQTIYSELRDRLSGIAVPQYVIDIPGGVSKANASASDVVRSTDGVQLKGRDGALHPYSD